MPSNRPSVLVVEDDAKLAEQLVWAIKDDYHVKVARDRFAALDALKQWKPQLVLLDLCLPPVNGPDEGFSILRATRSADVDTMVVVMSALEEREAALRAVSEGAYDFFPKPLDLPTLRTVMSRALERQSLIRENRQLRDQLHQRFHVDGIIGISPPMQRVFEAIRRVADSITTVIIQGESGTGKELVARAIHHSGGRRDGPFVPVHCAALPEGLLETELFGHVKGAFTGAGASRMGRFEAANGGTLFLDEIASLGPETQIKLLRVLEERTVERLGSNHRHPVDIRLVVATNEDLESKVRRGEFREDFFFRVNVFPICVPPLRERATDIPLLADHFLKKLGRERDLPPRRFSPETLEALMARSWPGNVRELSNLVETVALLADGEIIEAGDLPFSWEKRQNESKLERAHTLGFKKAVREYEKQVLLEAITRAGGVKSSAARELDLDAGQMKYLVRKHGL